MYSQLKNPKMTSLILKRATSVKGQRVHCGDNFEDSKYTNNCSSNGWNGSAKLH